MVFTGTVMAEGAVAERGADGLAISEQVEENPGGKVAQVDVTNGTVGSFIVQHGTDGLHDLRCEC